MKYFLCFLFIWFVSFEKHVDGKWFWIAEGKERGRNKTVVASKLFPTEKEARENWKRYARDEWIKKWMEVIRP